MKNFKDFMNAIRQGILEEEARELIGFKMKPDEKIQALIDLARKYDYDVGYHALMEDMKMADARAFEKEIQTAAKLGMNVEHNVRDYGWPFS
ncbi:MAG TPA: hypothetical protein VIK23_01325 [Acetobacterium sp.]